MLKRSMSLGCQHIWKSCSSFLAQMCQKGGTQHLLNSYVMGFELGGFCTTYSLLQLLSVQGSNLCHDSRAWCSTSFWVFLKKSNTELMQSWIHSSMQTISETSQQGIFSLLNKRRKWFWVLSFYVIFSIISLRNSQVPKHIPMLLKSWSSAGQGPWQHQRAPSHRCGGPDTITAMLCTGGKLQLEVAEQFSSGHLGRPPNSLATRVTPSVFASAQSGREPPRSSALLPGGDGLSVGCEARRTSNLIVKNAKHFWILLDEWQINDNSEVINWLT